MLELTRQIGHDMHRIAWELGPAALEELGPAHRPLELRRRVVRAFPRPRAVPMHGTLDGRLPPQVETTLYRVVQEALTNVAKHALAGRLSLILNRRADDVLVIIEDDGVGFDAGGRTDPRGRGRRLGLVGMHRGSGGRG